MKPRRRKPLSARRGLLGGKWPRRIVFLALVLALLIFLDSRLRPVVHNMAAYQAKVFATRTVNQALLQELDGSGVEYMELVHITQNNEGLVTSLQADMMRINLLKTNLSQSVVADLDAAGQQSIYIPLGTLLGNEWFSGRGPQVEIKVIPTGYVQTEIYNSFTSAGINQTLHQIMLRSTVQMMVIIPGYRIQTETTTNFVLAETVIVGTIPEAFTQINGDDAPLISKLNDYAAETGQ